MGLEKDIKTSLLLDFYGCMLTGKQKEAMDMYWNQDLSLSEIAENTGASRQAAMDSLKRAAEKLNEIEGKLGMLQKYSVTNRAFEEILLLLKEHPNEGKIAAQLKRVQDAWEDSNGL